MPNKFNDEILREGFMKEFEVEMNYTDRNEIANWWLEKFTAYKEDLEIEHQKEIEKAISDYQTDFEQVHLANAVKIAKAEIAGKIDIHCLKYCREQNGLDYCKNCSLSKELLQ